MYTAAFSAAALSVRSSLRYSPLDANHRRSGSCCGCCCHCCCVLSCSSLSSVSAHHISVNPRFLIGGYLLRQSAVFRWSPSRCSFRSSDGGLFEEMVGLLADGFTECDEGGFFSRSNGVDNVGRRRVGRFRFEVEMEDVDEKEVPVLGKHGGFGNAASSSYAGKKGEKGDLHFRKNGVLERKVLRIDDAGDDGAEESFRTQRRSSVIRGRGQHEAERKRYTSAVKECVRERDLTSVHFNENAKMHDVGSHGSSSNFNRLLDNKSNSAKTSSEWTRDNNALKHQFGDKKQHEDKSVNKSIGVSDQHSISNVHISNIEDTDARTAESSRRLLDAQTIHGQENPGLVHSTNIDRQHEDHTRVSQHHTDLANREDRRENSSTSQNFVQKERDSFIQRKQTGNFVSVNKHSGSSTKVYDLHTTDSEKSRNYHSEVEAKLDCREYSEASVQRKRDSHEHDENISKESFISHSNDIFEDARMRRREKLPTSVENQVQMENNERFHDQNIHKRVGGNNQYKSNVNVVNIHDSEAKRGSAGLKRIVGAKLDDREECKASFIRTEDVNMRTEDRANVSVGSSIRGNSQDSKANIRGNISNSVQDIVQVERDTRVQDRQEINTVKALENRREHATLDQHSWTNKQICGSNDSLKETSKENKVNEFSSSNALLVSGVLVETSSETEKNKESSQMKTKFVGESSLSRGTQTTRSSSGDVATSSQIQELDNRSSIDSGALLESVMRFEESSAYYVGEFIDKVHQEISAVDALGEPSKNSSEVVKEDSDCSTAQLLSTSGQRGPSDEMWDVKDFSSQKTSKTDEREESSSSFGLVDTGSSPGTDTSMARRKHRSLWAYIADVIQLGWFSHGRKSHKSERTHTVISSNESAGGETWFSGHEQDGFDATNKEKHTIPTETIPSIASSSQSHLVLHPITKEESSDEPSVRDQGTGMVSEITNRTEFSFWETDVEAGPSGIPSPVAVPVDVPSESTDYTIPFGIKEKITNSEILQATDAKSSKFVGEHNRGKEAVVDENVSQDGQLKQRKFQRNKQVLRQSFDEWEQAFILESEQRKVDELFMREALLEAKKAADYWEVPVGAVLVHDGKIIARGFNLVEELRDSTAHAEMICIREASNHLRTWRLAETTLYVTLEPCPMCAGAILQARIDTVVWGAPNKLLGADGSWIRLFSGDDNSPSHLNPSNRSAAPIHPFHPKIVVRRGVLERECSDSMQQFFRRRRKKDKESPPPHCLPLAAANPARIFTKMHNLFCAMFCL